MLFNPRNLRRIGLLQLSIAWLLRTPQTRIQATRPATHFRAFVDERFLLARCPRLGRDHRRAPRLPISKRLQLVSLSQMQAQRLLLQTRLMHRNAGHHRHCLQSLQCCPAPLPDVFRHHSLKARHSHCGAWAGSSCVAGLEVRSETEGCFSGGVRRSVASPLGALALDMNPIGNGTFAGLFPGVQ